MFEEYLRELNKVEILKPDQEKVLWQRFKLEGDPQARQHLVEAYQPLVFKLVMKLKPREDWALDLIQEASIGLIEAVDRYDPERGIAFPTYASFRIRGQVINYIQKYKDDHLSFEHALSSQEEDAPQLQEMIAEEESNLEEDTVNRILWTQPVREALEQLPEKERYILKAVFLNNQEPQRVAEDLQISLPHLYRLQKRGLKRVRGLLANLRQQAK